jgi:hypothetical protein
MYSRSILSFSLASVLLVGSLAACGRSSSPPPAPRVPPGPAPLPHEAFSAERAWSDLEALSQIGPRASGTAGARKARSYIREQLEALELQVDEIVTPVELNGAGSLELTHVLATIPGDSPQLFLLVAPYDSSHFDDFDFVGTNDGASGAALLLEFARVLAASPLPYTTRFAFLEGEGRLGRGGHPFEERRGSGSQLLADRMAVEGELAAVRLLVAFNRVCDADLRIARDLGSHRMHREEFWKNAGRLGQIEAFPPDELFESPQSSHLAFRDRGVRPVLAIEDTVFGGEEAPGIYADTEDDDLAHCAPESLETVGVVSLAALETIGERLAKIDRFARSPLTAEQPSAADPEPAVEAAEAAPEASEAASDSSSGGEETASEVADAAAEPATDSPSGAADAAPEAPSEAADAEPEVPSNAAEPEPADAATEAAAEQVTEDAAAPAQGDANR